ncbi:MAG: transcriptional regulator [Lachnospiraceae bacterium]|nr:transcriptional regulator [Lachnospiraceae bacterium]
MTDKALGEYLKVLRTHHGYSQEFVASHLNIIRQTYSHYETGRILPPLEAICTLAELYQVPVDSLLKLVVQNNSEQDSFISKSSDMAIPQKQIHLSAKESELLNHFRLLDKRDKEDILDYIKLKSQKAAKRNKTQQKYDELNKHKKRKGV